MRCNQNYSRFGKINLEKIWKKLLRIIIFPINLNLEKFEIFFSRNVTVWQYGDTNEIYVLYNVVRTRSQLVFKSEF